MEFLQNNWFSFLMLFILVMDRVWNRGKRDEKMQQVIDKVDELEGTLDSAVSQISTHIADPNIHITATLTELTRERNEYLKKEMTDARRDIRRIEDMLNKM